MKKTLAVRLSAAVGCALGCAITGLASTDSYEFFSGGVAYDINGATVFTLTDAVASAGTGNFGGYLHVGGNEPILEGISTDSSSLMPQVGNSQTSALPISALAGAQTTIGGIGSYYAFALDLNEPNNTDSFVSVDTVKIYNHASANISASDLTDFLSNSPTLVWDMDGAGDTTLLVDEILTPGSGKANLIFALPTSLFNSLTGYLFIQYGEGKIGVLGGKDFGNAGGFEEFGLHSGTTDFGLGQLPTLDPEPIGEVVPEAGTSAAVVGLAGLVATGLYRARRKTA